MESTSDYYFDSYSHFGIHEEMLKDTVRTLAYRDSVMKNKALFKDKVVLDIGCGTGILSMFAARAGAKLVIGIDMSDMLDQAKLIIEDNNLSDRNLFSYVEIILIKGKMEEVVLPVEKVDIIISEWMGYFLLFESMFDTVIFARDKYLKSDGLMFPDKATMYMCGIEDAEYKEHKIHYWENVYGFDMSRIRDIALTEPLVDTCEASSIVTDVTTLKHLDLMTISKEDLSFSAPFELKMCRNDYIHALVSYFDVSFTACSPVVHFSTGPQTKTTHWKQTIFYLKDVLTGNKGDALKGNLSVNPMKNNPRNLDIHISYDFSGVTFSSDSIHFKMQ